MSAIKLQVVRFYVEFLSADLAFFLWHEINFNPVLSKRQIGFHDPG